MNDILIPLTIVWQLYAIIKIVMEIGLIVMSVRRTV